MRFKVVVFAGLEVFLVEAVLDVVVTLLFILSGAVSGAVPHLNS